MSPGSPQLPFDHDGFTVADALRRGVPYGRLRNRRLAAPFSGTRVVTTTTLTLAARCGILLKRLGEGVFISHRTAAEIWRMHLEPPTDEQLDVSVV